MNIMKGEMIIYINLQYVLVAFRKKELRMHDECTKGGGHIESTETLWRLWFPVKHVTYAISEELTSMVANTYDARTLLINPRIGINVTFVRLLARESKNVVAADVGVS